MLPRCLLARPKVPLVVEVHAVRNRIEAVLFAIRLHDGKQFILAMEASKRVVADVLRPIDLLGWDDFDGDTLFLDKRNRVVQLGASDTGRVGNHGEHILSQRLMRHPGQVRRIDAPRISHKRSPKATPATHLYTLPLHDALPTYDPNSTHRSRLNR